MASGRARTFLARWVRRGNRGIVKPKSCWNAAFSGAIRRPISMRSAPPTSPSSPPSRQTASRGTRAPSGASRRPLRADEIVAGGKRQFRPERRHQPAGMHVVRGDQLVRQRDARARDRRIERMVGDIDPQAARRIDARRGRAAANQSAQSAARASRSQNRNGSAGSARGRPRCASPARSGAASTPAASNRRTASRHAARDECPCSAGCRHRRRRRRSPRA